MAIRGGFEIATAYVDLILDKDHAKQGVRELPRDLTPHADKAGRDTGNVISRGIRLSIVRNSPLIAAAIAGGLAAGAPLLLGAATVIMGGVAAVAAAQSQKVQSAWVGAWDVIKRGAIEDARILEPTFVRMAGTIASAFTAMRPAMRDAFGDLGPQLDVLTVATARFATSFTGGLMVAIRNGGPVIEGMAHFIEALGVGFEDAMTRMATHSAAAGDVWAQLGDIIGTLLSTLGELLGIGVEIAHVMLPALGGSLRVVLAVLEALGPLMPAVVAGFTAFKIARTAAGWLDTLGGSLAKVASGSGLFATAAGRGATVVAGMGRAIPLVAATMAAFAITTAQNEDRIKSWTDVIVKGGDGAEQLAAKAEAAQGRLGTFGEFMKNTFLLSDLWDDNAASNVIDDYEEAAKAAQEYIASLSPMARLQHEVTVAQENLSEAVDKFGPGSAQAAAAQRQLDSASAAVTRQLALEEAQLNGVTQAMIDMADQAAARANSDLGYRKSVNDTTQAIEDLKTAQADATSTATDISNAQLAVEDAFLRQAEAAKTLAFDALPATMDEQQRNALAAQAALVELDKLADMYGGTLPPNLETYRQSLQRIAGQMDTNKLNSDALAAGLESLGITVTQIPDTKDIRISAPTEEVVQKLGELGFTITELPNGDVIVSADTEEAKGNVGHIQELLIGLNGTEAHPAVILDDRASGLIDQLYGDLWNLDGTSVSPDAWLEGYDQFETDIARLEAAVLGLDGKEATPDASLDSTIEEQTQTDYGWLDWLDQGTANPQATLGDSIPDQVEGSLADLYTLDDFFANPSADLDSSAFAGKHADAMGKIGQLAAQRPVPAADLNSSAFAGKHAQTMGQIGTLAAQRPTPQAFLNDGSFKAVEKAVYQALQRMSASSATATITAVAYTSAAEAALNYAARNRTSTIYVSKADAKATGGPVDRVFAAVGRKVAGPGGPMDDLVRATGPGGTDYRLSAGEWIVNALSSSKYGDRAMRALNDGTAVVTLPEDRVRAHGSAWAAAATSTGSGVAVTPTANGATVSIGQLHVHIQGVFDLTKPMEMRRLGQRLRDVLISLDREHS